MKTLKSNFFKLIEAGASQAKGLVDNFNELVESFDIDAHMSYLNDRKNELLKKSNELFSDFADLMKQVKENLTDFSVTVPFDESIGEKMSYEVKNGKLHIEVSYSDGNCTRSNRTEVLIPENCIVEELTVTPNKIMKSLTITIPKSFGEKKEEEGQSTATKKPAYYCPKLGILLTEDEVENGLTKDGQHPVVKLPQDVDEEVAPKPKSDRPKRKYTKRKKAEQPIVEEMESPQEPEPIPEDGNVEAHISDKLTKQLQKNVSKYSKTFKREANGRFVRKEPNT